MINVLLVIHLLLAIAMVGVILLQRSEGGALGIGGGGAGGGVVTGRAAGNILTRTTGMLAAAFLVTSLALALLSNTRAAPEKSILDQPAPAAAPAAPAAPAQPAAPTR